MSIIIYLIPLSITLAIASLGVFFWTVKSRQYEDLDGDAQRIFHAEDAPLNVPET